MKIMFLNQQPRGPNQDSTQVEALLNSYASPGTTVTVDYPDEFDGGNIYQAVGGKAALNPVRHLVRGPALLLKTLWAEQNGYDAVIQSNTFDPGVEVGRAVVNIPVIGVLRTAMHVGLNLSDRIGITVPLSTHIAYTWRILRSYGLDSSVAGIRTLSEEAFPGGVHSAGLDVVRGNKDLISASAISVIKDLISEDGAEIILPLGGAVIPYLVDPADLERETSVQVLNTKSIGIRFAEMCVDLGMTQSFLTYPRRPR